MKFYYKLLILAICYFCYVSSCRYTDFKQRFDCGSPVEVSVDGRDNWTHLIVYSFKKPYVLKKDSFKRTPNLQVLTLGTVERFEEGAFNGLSKLDKLVIFDSDLEEIPKEIVAGLPIRSFQVLNKIRKISQGFFDELPDIRDVDIRNNSLGRITTGIFNGTSIYKLYLDFNGIDSIQEGSFYNMDVMIFLSLTANKLREFDARTIIGENNVVEQLWVNKNYLTKINETTFKGLPFLQNLYLELNQIEVIEDGTFHHLPELTFLDISNNKLTEIQSHMFPVSGSKLYFFFLHNNRITFLNNAVFLKNPKVKYISYGGNPFQCPCLDEIKDWTVRNKIIRLCDDLYFAGERPVCVFSDYVRDKCIYDVDLTKNLFETYVEALQEYPKLHLKCDTTKGNDNATLHNLDFY